MATAYVATATPNTQAASNYTVTPNETVTAPKVTPNGELFFINGSQGKLAAKLSLPELVEGEKCPMVIFSHGESRLCGGSRRRLACQDSQIILRLTK